MPDLDKVEHLEKMYEDGKRADKGLFAEQRTNILLRMGEHYKKNSGTMYDDLRARGVQTKNQKIRLVKNHIHRITNIYENSILEGDPSVTAVPYNESELQDVKAAEMNNSVIGWIKDTNNWEERKARNVHDMVNIGEAFVKIRFDLTKGKKTPDGKRSGELVIDRLFGFDLKRDPNSRDMKSTPWWIHEQMLDFHDFKKLVKNLNPEKLEQVKTSNIRTMKIFDHNTGSYTETRTQVLVKELFHKPSPEHPNGWYSMFTDTFIVVDGELPFGIYPIIGVGFDELTTSPRSASIIRVCRPYQVEINRAASKMAEHQITLGDDKVFIQKGTKISNGGYLHGVRAFQFSGQPPVIQSGRNGAQYLEYQISQIKEMYEAADLAFVTQDKQDVNGDPYQLLFRAMKHKKKFVKYVQKYERFEIEIFKTALQLAKKYLSPAHIIRIAGKSEAVNIEEFKDQSDEGFEIKVVPQSGDIEDKFGKVLSITQTLQYAGGQLTPDQIGTLIRNIPFGNSEQIFKKLTVHSDNVNNNILALDRGEFPMPRPFDKHDLMIDGLSGRMAQSDFRFLDPRVQEAYRQKLLMHEQLFVNQNQLIEQSKMGMIPTGGTLTTINTSLVNPETGQVQRVKIPTQAVEWLLTKLQTQGAVTDELGERPPQVQADIASNVVPINNKQPQAANNGAGQAPVF